jgi:succinyl-diaminopimelate desuccinylase
MAADLLRLTADLVAIPSVSHTEATLADYVESDLRARSGLRVERLGANVVARSNLGRSLRVVLAGHLDTVPANNNATPRLEGDTLWGLGSADMKGGLAVMLELAATLPETAVDVTLVFYAGEEVAREHNGLLQMVATAPHLLEGDVAILGEPTGARIEAGCQGVLKVEVEIGGARAHTARPWMGSNAIHRLAPVLDLVAAYPERRPVIDGCEYREALQAVRVRGGVAGNVVPDRASLLLNHRFGPDRDATAAEVALRSWLGPSLDSSRGDRMEVVEAAPAAAPALSHPILAALLRATGEPPRAKLGWTDVAFFAERGIPAVNFGPGDPELAHSADERVERQELESAYATLRHLLTTVILPIGGAGP